MPYKPCFSLEFKIVKPELSSAYQNQPFFFKEYGYCEQKKWTLSQDYDHNDILLLYIISGVTRCSMARDTCYLQENMIVLSACNIPIILNHVSKSCHFFYLIISGTHSKLYYNLIRQRSRIIQLNPLSNQILNFFLALDELPQDGSLLTLMHSSLILHQIFFDLYQTSYDITQAKKLVPIQESDMNRIITYIAAHYNEELTIDHICKQIHFSKYYFCKLFKASVGIPIYQYINEYRINKSKELLSYSKMSIKSISTAVGFKSSLSYIRCFKKIVNMTPSEYRDNF